MKALADEFKDEKLFLDAVRYQVEQSGNMADGPTKDKARLLAIIDRRSTITNAK